MSSTLVSELKREVYLRQKKDTLRQLQKNRNIACLGRSNCFRIILLYFPITLCISTVALSLVTFRINLELTCYIPISFLDYELLVSKNIFFILPCILSHLF